MPSYEYFCSKCNVQFEELLLLPEEAKKYMHQHPCRKCKKPADRIMSKSSFTFKAPPGLTQGTGVHGQSGVHDLDYPTLDKAVGRSSNKKWEMYNSKQQERDTVRKKYGTHAISTVSDKVTPLNNHQLNVREKALKLFKKAKNVSK